MGRALAKNFYNDLMSGCLKEVLDAVHNDTTLIMELRGNSVIIYYRGGALFTIDEGSKGYQISYNPAYWEIKKKYPELSEQPSIRDIGFILLVWQIGTHSPPGRFHFRKKPPRH